MKVTTAAKIRGHRCKYMYIKAVIIQSTVNYLHTTHTVKICAVLLLILNKVKSRLRVQVQLPHGVIEI